jgi:hypothetical protein
VLMGNCVATVFIITRSDLLLVSEKRNPVVRERKSRCSRSVSATQRSSNADRSLVLSSINAMIDEASSRTLAFNMHPVRITSFWD